MYLLQQNTEIKMKTEAIDIKISKIKMRHQSCLFCKVSEYNLSLTFYCGHLASSGISYNLWIPSTDLLLKIYNYPV